MNILTISNLTKILFFVLFFVGLFLYSPTIFAAEASPAPSATATAVCEGIGLTGGDCANGGGAGNKVTNIISTIISVFSWIVGAVAVIMLIYGGFKYVTSGGDQNKVKSAKDAIIYALIGLVIVALSQTIVFFVLDAANKSTKQTPQTQQAQN